MGRILFIATAVATVVIAACEVVKTMTESTASNET
jgi:hypothetical protein